MGPLAAELSLQVVELLFLGLRGKGTTLSGM